MSAPRRIQRKRTKGWRMPAGAVYVGRPSLLWGNPFVVGENGVATRQQAVDMFREYVMTGRAVSPDGTLEPWDAFGRLPQTIREHLADHDLACWCPLDQPCHADVLLEIANQPTQGATP